MYNALTGGNYTQDNITTTGHEALFAPNRTKTMQALQTIGQRMTLDQIARFPKSVAIFAPEPENDCGLIACPAREHALLYLSADLEQQEQSRITDQLAAELARLIPIGVPQNNEHGYTPEQEREAAELVESWTEESVVLPSKTGHLI
jgi:hypothetical protein